MTRHSVAARSDRVRAQVDAAEAVLARAGVASPRADAEELAAFAAGTTRWRLLLDGADDDSFPARYADLIADRARRVPLQHLTGAAAFGPLTLAVGPGVFIPRPETECLLEWATQQTLPAEPLIVDLCTGSGALAIALARHRPDARVLAVDESDVALGYARRNAAGTAVDLRRADVTQPALMPELDGRVDLLVANPPYVPDGAPVEAEVAQHDPPQAVFGGPDGMRVITAIVGLAARWLRPGGSVAIEHDDTTSRETVDLMRATGMLEDVSAHADLAGRPRFVTAKRSREP